LEKRIAYAPDRKENGKEFASAFRLPSTAENSEQIIWLSSLRAILFRFLLAE
jgi:hypothetical protein